MTTLPFTVPNVFANSTSNIALSLLDADFISVTDAINGIGNGSTALTSVNITGGSVSNVSFSGGGGTGDIGRNLLHNSMFNIQQRGAGPFTTATMTVDRWGCYTATDTISITAGAVPDSVRAQFGDESAQFYLVNAFGGTSTGINTLYQKIENVRRLAGKTITVSFWASASLTGMKLGVSIDQNMGTGGSPSATVSGNGQAVTLNPAWARYSLTFVIPSLAGKTLGTNSDSSTNLNFWFSAASSASAPSGGIGVQSGTIALWGVQLEVGSVATPLEKPDPRYDLANCQRFYTLGQIYWAGYQVAASTVAASTMLPVTMRATPTFTITTNASTNFGSPSIGGISGGVYAYGTSVSTGASGLNVIFNASADL